MAWARALGYNQFTDLADLRSDPWTGLGEETGMSGICDGLNVIEIGCGSGAAAITGMVLADAGARVVKVEPPEGDRLRAINPSGFLVWNRGKESLVADLRTESGRQTLHELAAAADVLIEGFAPGTTQRWGVGAKTLTSANPALIHCSITAFGSTGPYTGVKGYDSLAAAKSGLWARGAFGHRDGPLVYPVPWASFGSAMQAVAGILGALLVRNKTGRGQRLEATLYAGLEPIDYFVSVVAQLMTKRGEKPTTDSRSALSASRYGVLVATRDGRFIQTSTLLPHQGRALSEVAGIASIFEDPRFSRLPMFDTAEDAQAWEDLLLEAFRKQDLAQWLPMLEANPDIAFEVAVTSEEGLNHPQIVHNGDAISIEDPTHGPVRQVGPIGHFSATPINPSRSAPALGDYAGPLTPRSSVSSAGEAPAHPFADVTIVEFGCFYAMPYGVTMAAALGARVIKIEDAKGDPHRMSFGREVASTKTTAGKESLSIDLSTPEGQAAAQRVIAGADVFVTGFRSGIADKLGLGYEQLNALNPKLLYVHASGYGSDGPYAHRALYAQAAQAVAGSFGRQVGYWMAPERNAGMSVMELQAVVLPRLGQVVDGDSNAALAVLAALALGVYHQQRTGQGQLLRTSMIGGNAWAYGDDFCSYRDKPLSPLCDDEYYGTGSLDRVYQAANDSWVCIHVPLASEFTALGRELALPELADDPRFASESARKTNDAALAAILTERFAQRPAAEWERVMTKADVGCVEVNMQGQPIVTSFDPVLRETGLTVAYEHPLFGEMVRAAPPIAFSETPGRIAPPCVRGQHNRSILAEAGYSDEEIDRLEAENVVLVPDRRN
jgi:crotonobetainyl-CoA:carnitine CoA-transferase CaiB-like acyl-CoA transferase